MRRAVARAVAPLAVLALTACGVNLALPEELPDQWGSDATPSPIPEGIPQGPLGFEADEIAAVRILNDGCKVFGTGSGFAIDAHTVVTNRHVVKNHYELSATLYDGTPLTVTDVFVSKFGDLAVLTIEEELPSFVALDSANPSPDDYVRVIGYPEGDELTVTEGAILAEVDDELNGEGKVFSTSAVAKPGSSGSAAYGEEGQVIGVLYAGDNYGTTFIVPVELLLELLDNTDRQKTIKRNCDPF